jgi:hypothetical protein
MKGRMINAAIPNRNARNCIGVVTDTAARVAGNVSPQIAVKKIIIDVG